MKSPKTAVLAMAMAALCAGNPAAAAQSFRMQGVVLRLVAEAPGEDGRVRAALLVDLEPGWKTYWLDPGEAGLPPKLDFTPSVNLGPVEARFPAPHRLDDGFARSIVYSAPFAVALSAGLGVPGVPARIEATVALGICLDICLPVTASLDTKVETTAPATAPDVEAAFAALPKASGDGEGILHAAASRNGRALEVTVAAPGIGKDADLFVTAAGGWSFGPPDSVPQAGGTAILRVPIAARPHRGPATPPAIAAVLAGSGQSWRVDAMPVEPPADAVTGDPISPPSGQAGSQGPTTP